MHAVGHVCRVFHSGKKVVRCSVVIRKLISRITFQYAETLQDCCHIDVAITGPDRLERIAHHVSAFD